MFLVTSAGTRSYISHPEAGSSTLPPKRRKTRLFGVPKILGRTSRRSSSHQNGEESPHKHVSGNGSFFSLIEIFHSTLNTLLV